MKRIEHMSLWERAYLPEILRGLSVTGYHFWRNLTIHVLHVFGLAKTRQADVTIQYPEERTPYPDTFRGRHRLTLGADDTANCTACFLCATACPADCIYIEAGEDPHRGRRRSPRSGREVRGQVRNRYVALHLLRHVRRSLSLRRHSHGHRYASR